MFHYLREACGIHGAMKIYTRTGDDGTTGLFGGARVPKASARVDAYGTVDELNAAIGLCRTAGLDSGTDEALAVVQEMLFVVGAELACVPGKEAKLPMTLITPEDSSVLEAAIDACEHGLPALTTFVLPGGTAQAAHLHLARTICRRAERAMLEVEHVRNDLVVYVNRLSDFLFTAARRENFRANVADVPWAPRKPASP